MLTNFDLISQFSFHFYSAEGATSNNKPCSITGISLCLMLNRLSNTVLPQATKAGDMSLIFFTTECFDENRNLAIAYTESNSSLLKNCMSAVIHCQCSQ